MTKKREVIRPPKRRRVVLNLKPLKRRRNKVTSSLRNKSRSKKDRHQKKPQLKISLICLKWTSELARLWVSWSIQTQINFTMRRSISEMERSERLLRDSKSIFLLSKFKTLWLFAC